MIGTQKRIFIGLMDIASQLGALSNSLSRLGHQTIVVSYQPASVIVSSKVDYTLDAHNFNHPIYNRFLPFRISHFFYNVFCNRKNKRLYKKLVNECDIFIFFWTSFKSDFSDLAYLKARNKKIVCIHVGDDVRYPLAMEQEFKFYGMKPIAYSTEYLQKVDLRFKLGWLRNCEKFADILYSRSDQNQLGLRPYYKWRMMVNPDEYEAKTYQREKKPLILHSPSNRDVKGTRYILAAIEKLKQEGFIFEFELIENLPHKDALLKYKNADIVIDQVLCPGGGKFASECLAMGLVVLSKMGYDVYPDFIPEKEMCPIIDCGYDTVYDDLKEIINNYELRKKLSSAGPDYVRRNLNFNSFSERLMNMLHNGEDLPELIPTFFREKYLPPIKDLEIYNKFNKDVSSCEWYKKHVVKGERQGLVF